MRRLKTVYALPKKVAWKINWIETKGAKIGSPRDAFGAFETRVSVKVSAHLNKTPISSIFDNDFCGRMPPPVRAVRSGFGVVAFFAVSNWSVKGKAVMRACGWRRFANCAQRQKWRRGFPSARILRASFLLAGRFNAAIIRTCCVCNSIWMLFAEEHPHAVFRLKRKLIRRMDFIPRAFQNHGRGYILLLSFSKSSLGHEVNGSFQYFSFASKCISCCWRLWENEDNRTFNIVFIPLKAHDYLAYKKWDKLLKLEIILLISV